MPGLMSLPEVLSLLAILRIHSLRLRLLLTEIPRSVVLALGGVHEVADVTVNGSHAGVRICPPYEFALSREVLTAGENSLTVTVTTSLARAAGDNRFDRGRPRPIGLLGPVRWFTEEAREPFM